MASIKLTNESVEAQVEILQGQENYLAWRRDLKFIAEANDVWKVLNGNEVIHDKPTRPTFSDVQTSTRSTKKSNAKDADQNGNSVDTQASDQLSLVIQFYKLDLDEYEKQQKRLRHARGLLSTTINTALRGCIKDEEDPHLAMEILKGLCKMNDARALDMTLGKIEQLKFNGSVSDLINTLKTYQQDILDLNGTFSDEQLMSKVVRSLPNRFNRFLDTWNLLAGTSALPRDLVTLHGHLLGVEAQLALEKDNKEGEAKGKPKDRKERTLCGGCNKWGSHSESECWVAHPELRDNKSNNNKQSRKPLKKQVNIVTNTESKDDTETEPQHARKRPTKVVATITAHRDEWEAACASARAMSIQRNGKPDDKTTLSKHALTGSGNDPLESNASHPQIMMLLKDETAERSSKWIVDSGANICIANDKSWFSDLQKVTYTVGTANNGGLDIEGAGTVPLQLITNDNDPVELELHNVAYARDARCNILSLSWIAEKAKLKGIWDINGISIKTAEGFEIGHAILIDGLFHLQVNASTAEHPNDLHLSQGEPISLQIDDATNIEATGEDSTPLLHQQLPPGVQPPFVVSLLDYDDPVWKWHRRMGHLSIQSLRDLLKVSDGIDLTDKQLQGKVGAICPVCATTRAINKVPRDPATRRATNPGELMHADAWGPYPINAWDGTVYILAMTDDATRFTWSARFVSRDKIPEIFRQLHRTIERRHDLKIRTYRLDNEFPSHGALRDWFRRHAISLETTVPYTHHMNGVAERGFRTDRERASAMLQEATDNISTRISQILGTRTEETLRGVSLSETLWVEAFSHAIWIKNRSPSRALEGKKTPWEAFYKTRPNLAVERIFGSRVYVTFPPEHRRKSLLQSRGWIGYFVGFETEAVMRVWAPEKNRVVRVTAPRVDDGQGQDDIHDGQTLRDRIPFDDIGVGNLTSDHEENSETTELSPQRSQINHNTANSPPVDRTDELFLHTESEPEHQNQSFNTMSDSEQESVQENVQEIGQLENALAEEGLDYNEWDDHVFHLWHKTHPQVHTVVAEPSSSRQPTKCKQPPQEKCDSCRKYKRICRQSNPNLRCDCCRKRKYVCSLAPADRESRQDKGKKCDRCRKNKLICRQSDPNLKCDHCRNRRSVCSLAPRDRKSAQPKCERCRKLKHACRRSNPNSRCDRCCKDKGLCSYVPNDRNPKSPGGKQPLQDKCTTCVQTRRFCVPGDDSKACKTCQNTGRRCSFAGQIPVKKQDPTVKCESCRKHGFQCHGGTATTKCARCQKSHRRTCSLTNYTLNEPQCICCKALKTCGLGKICTQIPCTACQKSGARACSFRVDEYTAVYHPIWDNLQRNSIWYKIQRLDLQDECCRFCAELTHKDVLFNTDHGFPCNMCVTRNQHRIKGLTCIKANADGGYIKYFFHGFPSRKLSGRVSSPPPMTEAGTESGEDEEEWQGLDDYPLDEDLEDENDNIPIDPALLEPQANLTLAPRTKVTSFVSSTPIPRGMAVKGEMITKEAIQPCICLMSTSTRILGPEPHTRKDAMTSTEWKQWEQAMQEEYNSLLENQTWEIVDRPTDRKVLTGRWVFKRKLGPDGTVARHKARFVVRGFSQVYGLDFDETYASVVKSASYRILFALQARYGWKCHQMDIKTAFLNGDLEHEIFVEPPDGYPESNDRVLKLCKSLYGLKQAPRQWYFKLRAFLEENGWRVSNFDPSVFIQDHKKLIMEVYVDDINIFGSDESQIVTMKQQLASRFQMTDLGLCSYYLGMHVHQEANGDVHLHQESYVQQILDRYGLHDIHPRKTPMRTNLKLTKNDSSPMPLNFQRKYQSKVGALNYVMVVTRPDIAEAVGVVSRFSANPTEEHMKAVDDIYAYLKGTANLGLHFKRNCANQNLHAYVDADWAGCPDTRRSTTGYVVKLAGSPVSWSSRRQRTVATSTCEAEYIAGYKAAQEIIWIQNMINDLRIDGLKVTSTTLLIDNNAALKLTRNPELHDRTKHIELKYHFLRDLTLSGRINTQRVDTKDNLADLLTKPLPRDTFEVLREGLGMDKRSCTTLTTCS